MKITIITAILNRDKYLEKTILSVISQSYKQIEYIIIDGGSTDNSIEIIKKYSKNKIIRWISEKDESMYDAINKGILMSNGDYILNLNSDDWLHDDKVIENVVINIINSKKNAYFGNIIRFYQENEYARKITLKSVGFEALLFSEHSTFIPHSSLIVSKKLITEIGAYNLKYKYASDFDFILRILKSNVIIEHIPIYISVFREHSQSITSSGKLDKERIAILNEYNIDSYNYLYRKYKYTKNWIFYKIFNFN